jgi:hypothetical protein
MEAWFGGIVWRHAMEASYDAMLLGHAMEGINYQGMQ